MLKTLATATLLSALVATGNAEAVDRPPMKSCGDFEAVNHFLFADLTARRVTCRNARRVAKRVPVRCGTDTSSCIVRRFSCIVAKAAPELRFVRCSRAGEGDELFKTIRFEFGS